MTVTVEIRTNLQVPVTCEDLEEGEAFIKVSDGMHGIVVYPGQDGVAVVLYSEAKNGVHVGKLRSNEVVFRCSAKITFMNNDE